MDPVTALAGLRAGIGATAWATPNLAGKLFLLDPKGNPQSPYLARLFAVRDLALAAGVTQSAGEARRQWLTIGLACDVSDAVAALLGARAGYLSKVTAAFVFAPAAAGAALGAKALSEPSSAPGP